MLASPPFRPSLAPAARPAVFSIGGGKGRVVQGIFQARPFSFAAVNPGTGASKAVQQKSAIQRRPGVEAFQVDLRPKSGGWPLPRDVQAEMEAALGANFSDVRVHVGPEASAIGAIAFTWGSDLHFAPGQYNPHTPHGQFLLGHELAHVVQQRAGRVANPFGSGVAVVQDHALEAEADRLGRMASMSRAHGQPAQVTSSSGQATASSGAGGIIFRKAVVQQKYAVRPPLRSGSGWKIDVASAGSGHPVGSMQLTPSRDGVFISNLKVDAEHRRNCIAGQLAPPLVYRPKASPLAPQRRSGALNQQTVYGTTAKNAPVVQRWTALSYNPVYNRPGTDGIAAVRHHRVAHNATQTTLAAYLSGYNNVPPGIGGCKHFIPYNWVQSEVERLVVAQGTIENTVQWLNALNPPGPQVFTAQNLGLQGNWQVQVGGVPAINIQPTNTNHLGVNFYAEAVLNREIDDLIFNLANDPRNLFYRQNSTGDAGGTQLDTPQNPGPMPLNRLRTRLRNYRNNLQLLGLNV